ISGHAAVSPGARAAPHRAGARRCREPRGGRGAPRHQRDDALAQAQALRHRLDQRGAPAPRPVGRSPPGPHSPLASLGRARGARVAEYPIADRDAVAAAVARAREAQARWVALDFVERARILRRVRDAFIDGKERIADVVSGETGKPRHDVFTNELLIVCDGIGFWAKRAARYLADDKARPHLMKTKRAYTSYHPHGVVG